MYNPRLQIAFFGSSNFSVYVLEQLAKENAFNIGLIVTVPDSSSGRSLKLVAPPAKIWAEKNNVKVCQPVRMNHLLQKLKNYNLFIVASYGKIIPKSILKIPKYGAINIHPSLLPKYRGVSPIQTTIINGDEKTGVTLISIDDELDHGPIIKSEELQLGGWRPTYLELEEKLAKIGARMLKDVLSQWVKGEVVPEKQAHERASYTVKIKKETGFIEPEVFISPNMLPEKTITAERKIRALNPDPGAFTYFKSKNRNIRVKITKAHLDVNKQLKIDSVVPEGRRQMTWEEFLRGNPIG